MISHVRFTYCPLSQFCVLRPATGRSSETPRTARRPGAQRDGEPQAHGDSIPSCRFLRAATGDRSRSESPRTARRPGAQRDGEPGARPFNPLLQVSACCDRGPVAVRNPRTARRPGAQRDGLSAGDTTPERISGCLLFKTLEKIKNAFSAGPVLPGNCLFGAAPGQARSAQGAPL